MDGKEVYQQRYVHYLRLWDTSRKTQNRLREGTRVASLILWFENNPIKHSLLLREGGGLESKLEQNTRF